MKELSIEEKARRYDEAIERVKQFSEKPYLEDSKGIVEYIFPEFKESEDEKIRKWLICTLKSLNNSPVQIDGAYEMMLPAISWLEKQKHEEWGLYDEKILSEIFTSVEIAAYSEKKKKEIISWLQKYRPYMHEKKGLDNPAWSEEDEKMYAATIFTLAGFMSNEDKLDWLKSLKERYTWKPSDGQMASITCAVRRMKESACYDSELVSLLNDLKKLKE